MRRVKRFWKVALIGGAAALVFAVVAPVFGSAHPDADRLRLTEDNGEYVGFEGFFYGSDQPGTATHLQLLTNSKGCELNSTAAGPLVTLGPAKAGNVKGPGMTQLGIGVKTGGSNGTPCAETQVGEILEISSFYAWYRMDLDMQPKSNAWVEVRMYASQGDLVPVAIHQLVTGSSIDDYNADNPDLSAANLTLPYRATTSGVSDATACANPSDSGPDSGPNDNCYWTLIADSSFSYVEIEALVGSVALEGGSDFEGTGLLLDGVSYEHGGFDSLFYRALNAVNDVHNITDKEVLSDDVLANDGGLAGDETVSEVGGSLAGLALNADGTFTYTPTENTGGGTFYFTYEVSGSSGPSSTALVTINVTPVNDPPTAISPVDADEVDGASYTVVELATDVDLDTLTIGDADEPGASDPYADSGTVVLEDDGTISYTPNPDTCDEDPALSNGSFTDTLYYWVDDGSGYVALSATIVVTCVNEDPVPNDVDGEPDAYEVNERETGISSVVAGVLTAPDTGVPGLLSNDSDPEGDFLSIVDIIPHPDNRGAIAFDGVAPYDVWFTYTATVLSAADWNAIDGFSYTENFTYIVRDGNGNTAQADFTIEVHRVVCSGDVVTHTDAHPTLLWEVIGSFKLLTGGNVCKRYEVVADADAMDPVSQLLDPTITFTPYPNDDSGVKEQFSGRLTFDPQSSLDGGFFVGLTYQPDPTDPSTERDLLACLGPLAGGPPVIGADGFVVLDGARLPSAAETWCLAGGTWIATADGTAYVPTAIIYGEEDPVFGFK